MTRLLMQLKLVPGAEAGAEAEAGEEETMVIHIMDMV